MRISNLQTQEGREINGKTGEVVDFDAIRERWAVTVDERTLNLKSENLELCFTSPHLQIIFMSHPAPWTRKLQDGGPVAGEFQSEDPPVENF